MAVVSNRTKNTAIAGLVIALAQALGLINTDDIPAQVMEQLDLFITSGIGLFLALKGKNIHAAVVNGKPPPP